MDSPGALYEPDGELFQPTVLTRGPWSPKAQHGSPVGALLATCAERVPSDNPMLLARITVELLRPVPLTPLSVTTEIERPGRKIQILGLRLRAGETEVARARALRIRTKEIGLPAGLSTDDPPPPPSSGKPSLPAWDLEPEKLAFHSHAVEHRFVAGAFDRPGPGVDWVTLAVPVVAGEDVVPIARVMAAADFGNGVSWELDRRDGYSFINPDLTVYVDRLPVGESVAIQSRSRYQPVGIGFAESLIWDEGGPIGRSIQSLLLDRVE